MLTPLLQRAPVPILQKRRAADALPVSLFYDHFTGTNDATLAARVPPVSANGNGWLVPQGSFVTNNGRAEARFPSVNSALANIITADADADIRVRFRFPVTGTSRVAGILFRRTGNNDYWSTVANVDLGVYRILEITASVSTVRAEINFAFQAGVDYDMRLVLVGDRMFSTIDGIGTISYESSVRNTETRHGLRAQNTVGQGAIQFENFIILPPPPAADVYITVAPTVALTSAYETAVVHTESDEIKFGNATARARAMASVEQAIKYHHSYLISGGVSDIWTLTNPGSWTPGDEPVPAEPHNWSSLDLQMSRILEMGGTPVLTLHLYEWWMKGHLQTNGTTIPATLADQFSEDGRLMTQYLPHERLRIRRLCERYMVAPYNVRHFVMGIEMHGWFLGSTTSNGSNLTFNRYAYHDFEGTPGLNANMGVAYYHNEMGAVIHVVATELSIPLEEITIINNYPRLLHRTVPDSNSVDSGHALYDSDWGTPDKRPLEVLELGLPLINPDYLQAVAFDFGVRNDDHNTNGAATDDWANLAKFTDYSLYVQGILDDLTLDVPMLLREVYSRPQEHGVELENYELRASLHAEVMRRMVEAGVWQGCEWGFLGRAEGEAGGGPTLGGAMFTEIDVSSGGVALPVLDAIRIFNEQFSAGTPIHDITISGTGVSAIASDEVIYLINKTNEEKVVNVNNATGSLAAYGRLLIEWT